MDELAGKEGRDHTMERTQAAMTGQVRGVMHANNMSSICSVSMYVRVLVHFCVHVCVCM